MQTRLFDFFMQTQVTSQSKIAEESRFLGNTSYKKKVCQNKIYFENDDKEDKLTIDI